MTNISFSSTQLREILINLGVKSPDLVDLADDWLKPIMRDSIEYQKLKDRRISSYENSKKDGEYIGCLFIIVIIIAILDAFFHIRKQPINNIEILLALIGVVLVVGAVYKWIVDYFRYKIASKDVGKYAAKWVKRVEANPVIVEKLIGLNKMIQDCETILRQKNDRWVDTNRGQAVEYILITKGDWAQPLADFFSAFETSNIHWIIKRYLVANPLLYALIYLYNPVGLLSFMDACYALYLKDPVSFSTGSIEKLFEQFIVTG